MTSSSRLQALSLVLWLVPAAGWASLGDTQSSIDTDRVRMRAHHAVARVQNYAVHDLKMTDGSRVRQYVAGNGRVFAVSWNTLAKPALSNLLGSAFPDYASAAQVAARRGGIQRQFRHEGADLVVQTSGHLHVYAGYAYRRSLLPAGLSVQSLGLG
jgi:hypothetical protein